MTSRSIVTLIEDYKVVCQGVVVVSCIISIRKTLTQKVFGGHPNFIIKASFELKRISQKEILLKTH